MRHDCLLLLCLSLLPFLHVEGERRAVHLSWEDKLIKRMLARYKARGKFGRPVMHYNDTMNVNFMIQLVQIMDLDEKNQVLTLNVWDRYTWFDIHLQWDPEQFGGVDQIRVPSDKVWIPDVRLYNYADSRLEEHRDALVVVTYNGSILWMPQAIYRSSCEIDVQGFPFDIQSCELKFGSWTYDGNKVDLNLLVNEDHDPNKIDMSAYVESNSWKIIDAPAKKRVQLYTCCPNEPFVDLAFTLVFQRRATFYNYILILPCILLTSITLVLFWIPPESPAKLMLGISIFVAFFLLLLLMESNLPPAATTVPLLGTYYCLNMILITLSSFLNAFVVYMSFYGARRPVPRVIKKVLFGFFGGLLCMDNLVRPYREQQERAGSGGEGVRLGKRLPQQECTRFLGVNGDNTTTGSGSGGGGGGSGGGSNKWTGGGGMGESRAPTDILVTVSRPGSGTGGGDEQTNQLALINYHLTELMDFVKRYKERLHEKDRRERMVREWKAAGLVFDRIFFVVYIIAIITSLCVLMPLLTMGHELQNRH
ncbi:neuronal acetylcholine receptor subunit alpha-10-like [Babylonia areolata]|uniref:neuronal acetylcholine receptor subunit alpha-10-like n=1 Tax=Babylonia areolata TaxID=304850 RepID=UPI003FD53292